MTGQTLELLHGEFEFENGTSSARNDAFLIKNNIKTYLISPPKRTDDVILRNFIVIETLSAYKLSPAGADPKGEWREECRQ